MKNVNLRVQPAGYGHWKISMDYYNKTISATTTNSIAVDDYNSEDERRSKRGYKELVSECKMKRN